MQKYNKVDILISLISLGLIMLWLLLCMSIEILSIIVSVIGIIFIILVLFSAFSTFNGEDMNNSKEGYYAQYGESFGANAHKHEKYKKKQEQFIEEQVANKIINKK